MKGTHRLGLSPSWKRTVTIPVVAALLAGAGSAAASAADPGPVVPPGGSVAGHGYPYWLGVADQIFFNSGGTPPVCQTLHSGGQAVEFLDGNGNTAGKTIGCRARAQEPIFVLGIGDECSTVHGDHKGFGTSATELRRCAKHEFNGVRSTASIDGVAVSNYAELAAAAPVVHAQLPKHNAFHLPPLRLRSASYAESLLLRGLEAGTHTIVVKSFTPRGNAQQTYVVRVS